MQESLQVLENYVPAYFKGVQNIVAKSAKINVNKIKPKVSQNIRNLIKQNFTAEIEFYEYCKQRLLRQYLAIK